MATKFREKWDGGAGSARVLEKPAPPFLLTSSGTLLIYRNEQRPTHHLIVL